MKSQKRNEWTQRIFILVLMGLLFFVLFFRPQLENYRDNRLLLENKRKILQASRLEISEDEYLNKLSAFELELDRYRKLIPEEESQQERYDGLKEVIEKSEVTLIELHFGRASSLETGDQSDDQMGDQRELYGIPIKMRLAGDAAALNRFFRGLKEACPLVTIDSFTMEELAGKMYLDLELWGYFF